MLRKLIERQHILCTEFIGFMEMPIRRLCHCRKWLWQPAQAMIPEAACPFALRGTNLAATLDVMYATSGFHNY
jgi:hypothetical protein